MSDSSIRTIVLYSDGSAQPNPGFIGYGVHGYSFEDTAPKNKVEILEFLYTAKGYAKKTAKVKKSTVTPVKIYDIYGSDADIGTNNSAELKAYLAALRLIKDEPVQKAIVNSDSKYVCKGASEWLSKWEKANWLNSEGRTISNDQLWRAVRDATRVLEQKGIELTTQWIKGHSGDYGNDQADFLADMGRAKSIAKLTTEIVSIEDALEDIKKNYSQDKPPLLCKPWVYFSTITDYVIPGEYYLGNIGKDKDFLGRKDANGGYAIVQLKEPFAPIEAIRSIQHKLSPEISDVFVLNLNTLMSGRRANVLMQYKEDCLSKFNPRREDLYFIENLPSSYRDETDLDDEDLEGEHKVEPIVRQQKPPKLSLRVFECLTQMKAKLDEYTRGDKRHNTYYDITNEFFDITVTSNKNGQTTKYKFKKDITVSTKYMDVEVTYGDYQVPVRIDFDIDAPSRNSIKRLEKTEPKIVLQIWNESAEVLRYNTIVQTSDSLSIWSGMYSNSLILTDKMKVSR